MKQCFLTGCDSNTEWMLEWFIKNYQKHNKTPLVFVDFGVTKDMRTWLYQVSGVADIIDVEKQKAGGWFYKPLAMYKSPAEQTCWIDTDIHVLGDISGVWNHVAEGKLGMVEDKPWSWRRKEKWHNSGVVAFKGKPPILKKWVDECRVNPKVGDQEVLHEMLRISPLLRITHIDDLPNKYNWLRLQLLDNHDDPNKLCMHWTGQKGKDKIRKLMYNE